MYFFRCRHVFLQIYHLPSPLCGKHINTFSRCESWALLTHFQFFTKKFTTKKTHIEHCRKYDLCMMRTLVLLFQWNTAIVLILKAGWSRQWSYTQRDRVWIRKWKKKSSWISDLSQIFWICRRLPILISHSVEGKYAKYTKYICSYLPTLVASSVECKVLSDPTVHLIQCHFSPEIKTHNVIKKSFFILQIYRVEAMARHMRAA